jgi:hypothetical protein
MVCDRSRLALSIPECSLSWPRLTGIVLDMTAAVLMLSVGRCLGQRDFSSTGNGGVAGA